MKMIFHSGQKQGLAAQARFYPTRVGTGRGFIPEGTSAALHHSELHGPGTL